MLKIYTEKEISKELINRILTDNKLGGNCKDYSIEKLKDLKSGTYIIINNRLYEFNELKELKS